jgi:hypothetical protein
MNTQESTGMLVVDHREGFEVPYSKGARSQGSGHGSTKKTKPYAPRRRRRTQGLSSSSSLFLVDGCSAVADDPLLVSRV